MATEVDLETPTTSSLAINRKNAVIVDIDECGKEVERRPENARRMPQRRRSIGVTRTAYGRIALVLEPRNNLDHNGPNGNPTRES